MSPSLGVNHIHGTDHSAVKIVFFLYKRPEKKKLLTALKCPIKMVIVDWEIWAI